jgi:chemotaxis-related protein WspD
MNALPILADLSDCWNHIGVHGDRSCAELANVGHCHNCTVFAAAGRRFLDAPSPAGYLEEWTQRLAHPIDEVAADLSGVLIFRLHEEWLALPVGVLVEVTSLRPVHRIPHRGGILAGLVNIRGELHLAAHLDQVLGIRAPVMPAEAGGGRHRPAGRLLVVRREAERWVFRTDEVDQVYRLSPEELTRVPATVGRASAHLTQGVFRRDDRTVGLVDDERLFGALRARMR